MDITTVVVRGLSLPFSIGVLDHERQSKQTVTISIDIRVAGSNRPGDTDEVFFSYVPIVQYLTGLSENGRHIELVEDLAQDIVSVLFAESCVQSVRVEILKPDIFPKAEGVGVVVECVNPGRSS